MTTAQGIPKHEQVRQVLEREIRSGLVKPGERLASEADLVERFGVSRITVGRAVRELQRAGLVERRAGSGTYVRQPRPAPGGLSFGLLIPDLGETEIFEPICQGMMASPLAREHALLWGSPARPGGAAGAREEPSADAREQASGDAREQASGDAREQASGDAREEASGGAREERAWQLCEQYIQRKVDGVFFAPLERAPSKDETNRRVVEALEAARIPIVLLDRPVLAYPGRGGQDLVGIDNARAGYLITEHLLRMGCRRVAFVALPDSAATVDMRESGYREAHHAAGLAVDRSLSRRFDPAEAAAVAELMATQRPDGIVCANDWTAARLMHALLDLGHAVPGDVRIVGIDDVEYAKLLPVPLTTFRQPTREIGAAALAAMLERVAHPELPPRDILLHGRLVVRRSCGAPD